MYICIYVYMYPVALRAISATVPAAFFGFFVWKSWAPASTGAETFDSPTVMAALTTTDGLTAAAQPPGGSPASTCPGLGRPRPAGSWATDQPHYFGKHPPGHLALMRCNAHPQARGKSDLRKSCYFPRTCPGGCREDRKAWLVTYRPRSTSRPKGSRACP